MAQRESKLSRRIMDHLRTKGAFCFKVHGSEHMMAGLPDVICCYRGYFIGFEVKNPESRANVSKIQEHVHERIREAEGRCYVVCGPEEAASLLRQIDSLIGE